MTTDLELMLFDMGALDPPEAARIAVEVDASPALRQRLAALRALSQAPRPPRPRRRIPPPGASWSLHEAPRLMLGPDDEQPLRFVLDDRTDAADRLVVVLRRGSDDWSVYTPDDPDRRRRLADVPLNRDGARQLDLGVVPVTANRWGVALPRWDLPVAWHEPGQRWSALWAGIEAGNIPVASAHTA